MTGQTQRKCVDWELWETKQAKFARSYNADDVNLHAAKIIRLLVFTVNRGVPPASHPSSSSQSERHK